jgi:hypothetical protein
MITRKEYMSNSSELFEDYYAQFVTQETKDWVTRVIKTERLKSSECYSFNDLGEKFSEFKMRGNGWIWDNAPINYRLARKLGETVSQCTHTCVGKQAARILLRGRNNETYI